MIFGPFWIFLGIYDVTKGVQILKFSISDIIINCFHPKPKKLFKHVGISPITVLGISLLDQIISFSQLYMGISQNYRIFGFSTPECPKHDETSHFDI